MSLDISEVRSARLCDVCSLPYRQQGLLLECLSLRRFHTPCSDESLSFGGNPSIQSFARTHEPLQYPFRTVTLAFLSMAKAWSLAVAPCPTAEPPGLSSRGAGVTSPGRGLDAMVGERSRPWSPFFTERARHARIYPRHGGARNRLN